MNIIDIIIKKKDKLKLSEDEIDYFINGYVNNEIKDYQISSLLMSIVLNGMDEDETYYLTKAMVNSGEVIDLSSIKGISVDKHSTGGVGDKVSLILGPILAACGLKLAKMSGRGLGHTGGTIDKLESIPHLKTNLSDKEYLKQVNDIGLAIIAQTKDLVIADKKLYALRDVTGTVQSIPLIASSIMSKKIACNTDCILLDVKVGKGAFMKTIDEAQELSKLMIKIGKRFNKKIRAVITDMNIPLGKAIGNNLEIIEAIDILNNKGSKRLRELCIDLAIIMLLETKIVNNKDEAYLMVNNVLNNGLALQKFVAFIKAQHGDDSYIENPNKFDKSKNIIPIKAKKEGYLNGIDALQIGKLSLELGAGRHVKEDVIDYSAGIVFKKEINDYIMINDIIAYLHTNKDIKDEYINMFEDAITINDNKIANLSLIKAVL
ncbi:MAG: thymidine phosphorylase [Bacilli bacterium]|jgi:pyrimidine-nucleoside phosphorylase|nr:thymidine phosphorylase [Bacilli bacterium]